MSTVNSRGHVGTVSYLTTLFLGKPSRGSLPILNAHSFTSNRPFAFLVSAERNISITLKNVLEMRVDLRTTAYKVDMLQTELSCPVFLIFVKNIGSG